MRDRLLRVPLLLGLALLAAAVVAGTGALAAEEPQVQAMIVGRAYQPDQLTVGLGQSVVWENRSITHHTVTSTTGLFDSGSIAPGASYAMTFTSAGTYDYKCTIHPTMKGSVVVLALAPGTLQVKLTARHSSHGRLIVAHVQAARSGTVLLQTRRGGHWQTLAHGALDSQARATLTSPRPVTGRLRVQLAAALGQPAELSAPQRAPA